MIRSIQWKQWNQQQNLCCLLIIICLFWAEMVVCKVKLSKPIKKSSKKIKASAKMIKAMKYDGGWKDQFSYCKIFVVVRFIIMLHTTDVGDTLSLDHSQIIIWYSREEDEKEKKKQLKSTNVVKKKLI